MSAPYEDKKKRKADSPLDNARPKSRGIFEPSDSAGNIQEDNPMADAPRIVIDVPDTSQVSFEPTGYISHPVAYPRDASPQSGSFGDLDLHHSSPLRDESVEPEPSLSYRDDADQDLSFPQEIKCSLRIIYDGSTIQKLHDSMIIQFQEQDILRVITPMAQEWIRKHHADKLKSKKPSFRYANCAVVGNKGYRKRLPLRSREDWRKIRAVLFEQWSIAFQNSASSTREKFKLEILMEYSACTRPTGDGTSVAKIKELGIWQLKKKSWNRRRYIPSSDLNILITTETIREILEEDTSLSMETTAKEKLIRHLQSKALLLSALCLAAPLKMDCLKKLVDNGVTDKRLPLEQTDCCHEACESTFERLLDSQASLMAARFDKLGEHQPLDHSVVLPIHFCPRPHNRRDAQEELEYEPGKCKLNADAERDYGKASAKCGSGGYSEVYCVKIDPNHHSLSTDRDACFALKEFTDRPHLSASFEKELNMMDLLRRYSDPHIVTHLASWSQEDKFYILFPYAECDLHGYMSQTIYDSSDKLWLLEQLCGLASALKQIHDLRFPLSGSTSQQGLQPPSPAVSGIQKSGWHHDIKPGNILFFWDTDPPRGTFRFSDWGFGKVHTYRSASVKTASPNGTLTYEPPEVMDGTTSRPHDVWSLGCVFLEILIWVAWGFQDVEKFGDERMTRREVSSSVDDDSFFERSGDGVIRLRDSVTRWIQNLEKAFSLHNQDTFKDVLNRMVKPMLEIRSSNRILADDVLDILNNILKDTKVDAKLPDSSVARPRLSLDPQARRTVDTTPFSSPLTRDAGYVGMDFVTTSPGGDTLSPRSAWGNRSLNSSVAGDIHGPRSRNTSNASSTMSIRGASGNAERPDAEPT